MFYWACWPSKTQQEKRLRTHPLLPSSGNGTIEWPEFLKIFQVLERMEEKEKQKRLAGGFDDAAGAVKPTGQGLKVPA